jgi:small subunit ribosomal protein S4
MSRYLGPKICLIKRLGDLPGFKTIYKSKTLSKLKENKKLKDFGLRLNEKQKIKYNYGITEIQLYKYVKNISTKNNKKYSNLLNQIESRIDNIVYRLGFAKTIPNARQLVSHGKILINKKKVNIPSFQCKLNDFIELKTIQQQSPVNRITKEHPSTLSHNIVKCTNSCGQLKDLKFSNNKQFKINERLIIEFYAKK